MITLDAFVVFEKLYVRNIRVEPRKVKAEYCVEQFSGQTSSYELIYSYEKTCFDRKKAEDVNLASMMLCQVALNYGLFCKTIVFDGLFDRADHSFLLAMLENTSREIVTNKLLIKNVFLKPPYDTLQPEKRARYTQANLVFLNTRFSQLTYERSSEKTDSNKYAILSSGGKDSLLTYGMINEIGEAFPVFINEAGRHWFTAVNAHRQFQQMEPNTQKPWCNSDRVFNWMLKHLPFIRENHADIRSDIYPVRLWTVAVFLFGVLPIVRRNDIGNILVGNEYDTTEKVKTAGISHYNGLYDQSKYFDNALTRYYQKKGWHIRQYSVLRSLSELLIMKILTNRYPDLQHHQMSCHAAHKAGDKMVPCGNCEKCRRIIGMLKALDMNPGKCGYTETQIHSGLAALESKSVKQIGSDASHLYYLLLSKKLIAHNDHTKRLAGNHPEITKLRFDAVRSNLSDMPTHIRRPLFNILSKYADGAVHRTSHRWNEIDLNETFLNASPYQLDEK